MEDERFKHITSDPRFRVQKRKERKIQIDERFQSMFTDKKFTSSPDKLKKFYDLEQKDIVEPEDEDNDGNEDEESLSEAESDNQESLSESSDESESDPEAEPDVLRIEYNWQPLDHDAETAEITTRRLAIQNLDWDQLDVKDLFTLFKSVRMPINVRIYVSQYGKDRLAREEKEGPEELADIPKDDDVEEEYRDLENKMEALKEAQSRTAFKVHEYEDADEEMDCKNEELRERIRTYQLNKMRYYYAIAEFDSSESAELVYKELDGLEYEGSSLALDLRFVPEDVEFDPKDMKAECVKVPDLASYKAPQFINAALQQTNVKFTWDQTDVKREEKLRRAYTKDEMEKDDLDAYLASSGSDSDDDQEAQEKYKRLLSTLDQEEEKKKKVDVDVVWGDYEEDERKYGQQTSSPERDFDDEDEDDEEDEDEDEDEDDGDNDDDTQIETEEQGESEEEKEEEQKEDLELFTLDSKDKTLESFKFDPHDQRFQAVYHSALYNIDPSHPNFKRSQATDAIAKLKRDKRLKID